MKDIIVHHGNCLDVVLTIGQVDAIVTDPPYEIGFMSQEWDKRGVAFDLKTWRRIGRALKPGGYLLAFGGTRTWHRLACAIEDAGFVIQDTIAWVYGQGLPKGKALLKPAFEPIIMAYKPGGERDLQIDECRIESTSRLWREPRRNQESDDSRNCYSKGLAGSISVENTTIGRWPANFCHDGSDEVLALFPDSKGQQGDLLNHRAQRQSPNGIFGEMPPAQDHIARGDAGSAARFFYQAKANKHDRAGSKHPTVKPQALMRWLVQLVTPPGGTVLDPFAGSGSTGQAALAVGRKAILIEQEAHWIADIHHRLKLCDKQQSFDL